MQKFKTECQITGLYLGWDVPERGWHPLMKLERSSRGYEVTHTSAYPELTSTYKGMEDMLVLPTIDGKTRAYSLPDVFTTRIPRLRPDVERRCKFLGIDYPNIDNFKFLAKTGGQILGDEYDICPILEPNELGIYQFDCLLKSVDRTVKIGDKLEFKMRDNTIFAVFEDKELGKLPTYLLLLGDSIASIEIINSIDDLYLGGYVLIRVTTKNNIYLNPRFELLAEVEV
jgi:hypothetical protein